MRASFYHDTVLQKDKSNLYYTSNGLDKKLFDGYLRVFSKLTIVVRKKIVDAETDMQKLSPSNTNGVNFNCIDKLSIINLFMLADRQLIKQSMRDTDFAIIRMPSIIGIAACIEARRQKKQYIIEMVGCPLDTLWYYGKVRYKVAALILYLVNKLIVRTAPNVTYVSSHFLQYRYPTKGNECACSDVQIPVLQKADLSSRLEKIDAHDPRAPYRLGTVANVDMAFKDQKSVIQAIAILNKSGYNFEYDLVGAGDPSKLAKVARAAGVQNKINFLGSLPHDKVFGFMKGIDIYIQPSLAESHGRVIIEAFSVACPVIGSNAGGIPELVNQRYVFKKGSHNDLARKLKTLVEKGELSNEARANFETAKKFNTLRLMAIRANFIRQAARTIANEK
jgi:glycosyltransferase involved in cell wall biosynthesis